jgi:hypothetical protein
MIYTEEYTTDKQKQVAFTILKAFEEMEEGKSLYLIVGDKNTIRTIFPTDDPRWEKIAKLLYENEKVTAGKRKVYLSVRGEECHPKKGDIVIDLYTMLTYWNPSLYGEAHVVILPWLKHEAERLQPLYPMFSLSPVA